MRVLVTGDRFFDDEMIVRAILSGLEVESDTRAGDQFVVIEGQCPKGGADKFAESWAMEKLPAFAYIKHAPYPADWSQYGRAAGPIRNRQMLREGEPDIVIAFHNNLEESKGTKDMMEIAEKAGVPVYHVRRVGQKRLF